jgi:hypothetical protein
MTPIRKGFAAALLAALVAASWIPARAAEPSQLTPIQLRVLTPPDPVKGTDGNWHLVYEIQVGNGLDSQVDLKTLAVLDQDGRTIATLSTPQIVERFGLGGRRGTPGNTLGNSQFAVLFMHVELPGTTKPPTALRHRIEVTAPAFDRTATFDAAPTSVGTSPAVVLGPPLRGKNYIAGDSCCDTIRHVRALLSVDGAFHLSQRFAIDWEQLDESNRVFTGDAKVVTNYVIYGKPILASADATVTASVDQFQDQVPGALPAGMTLAEADGNHVVLDLGDGRYVLYAHMKPGSVAVKAGEKVRRGQVIGHVGNTGNSQAPHVHIQVMDGPSTFASNGLPYVYDRFALTGIDRAGTPDFDRAEATGVPATITPIQPPSTHEGQLPLDLTIVDWLNASP